MNNIECEPKLNDLDQVKEMIQEILDAKRSGIDTPELDSQLEGLILRQEDLSRDK